MEFLNRGLSDHSPLLLKCAPTQNHGGMPFKIFNYMAYHEEFANIVRDTWKDFEDHNSMQQVGQAEDIEGQLESHA